MPVRWPIFQVKTAAAAVKRLPRLRLEKNLRSPPVFRHGPAGASPAGQSAVHAGALASITQELEIAGSVKVVDPSEI